MALDNIREDILWAQRYRPSTIEEAILPEVTKKQFQKFIDDGNIPNLLLSGPSGTGKTTSAVAMLRQLDCDYIIINGSLNGGIDTLRFEIANFASSVSFTGKRKYVIIDEADYLTANAQASFRNFLEEYSKNCGFIFTCNYRNKIIEPLRGRFTSIEFTIANDEKPKLAMLFFKRVNSILDKENVEYDKRVVGEVISKYFPDFRRVFNELQGYAACGKIDVGILKNVKDESIASLFDILKSKDFDGMLKWCSDNSDEDMNTIFTKLFKARDRVSTPPDYIVTLGEYQYKHAHVANPELNMCACLTEIMFNCEIK
jgi:DNA polymerase III delta prime subunit